MVSSFSIEGDQEPVFDKSLLLTCTVDGFVSNAYIYHTDSENVTGMPHLAVCTTGLCLPKETERYTFNVSGNVIIVTIKLFDKLENGKYWTCSSAPNNKNIYLQAFCKYAFSAVQLYHLNLKQ